MMQSQTTRHFSDLTTAQGRARSASAWRWPAWIRSDDIGPKPRESVSDEKEHTVTMHLSVPACVKATSGALVRAARASLLHPGGRERGSDEMRFDFIAISVGKYDRGVQPTAQRRRGKHRGRSCTPARIADDGIFVGSMSCHGSVRPQHNVTSSMATKCCTREASASKNTSTS